MIYHPLSQHVRSTEYPLAKNAVLSSDGQALVAVNTGGVFGVAPSMGVAGEVFAGFSTTQTSAAPFLETTAVKVEKKVVPASGTVKLANAPINATTSVFDETAGAADASITVTGDVVGGLTVGSTVSITYTYALSAQAAIGLMGNAVPSGYAGTLLGQVGVSQSGRIFTNNFDSSKDWSAATAVKLGANGKVTDQSGSGVAIQAMIVSRPTEDQPFLGLEFTA